MLRFSSPRLIRLIAWTAVAMGVLVIVARWCRELNDVARRTQCASNMRNVVLALLSYANSQNTFPAGTWPNPGLAPRDRPSWYGEVVPQLDECRPYYPIDRTEPWNVGTNLSIACEQFPTFRCPDGPGATSPAVTSYIGIAGLGTDAPHLPRGDPRAGIFGYDRQTTIADVKDGLATTMLIAETGRVSGSWLAGGPATVRGLDPAEQPHLGPGRQFGGMHRGGTMIGFADGSVRFVSDSIDLKIFEALSTIAGGEKISDRMWD